MVQLGRGGWMTRRSCRIAAETAPESVELLIDRALLLRARVIATKMRWPPGARAGAPARVDVLVLGRRRRTGCSATESWRNESHRRAGDRAGERRAARARHPAPAQRRQRRRARGLGARARWRRDHPRRRPRPPTSSCSTSRHRSARSPSRPIRFRDAEELTRIGGFAEDPLGRAARASEEPLPQGYRDAFERMSGSRVTASWLPSRRARRRLPAAHDHRGPVPPGPDARADRGRARGQGAARPGIGEA